MTLTPQALYQQELQDGTILSDPAQQFAVEKLEQLFQILQQPVGLFGRKTLEKKTIQGLYLWGSVGVGKTYLMDLFYACLPDSNKLRLHYHHFMARIHEELRRESGNKNPLQIIAHRLAKKTRVLCLDELYITDIGDGMIIYNLLKTLFEEGVVVVVTSNFPVDKLYKDDLQPRIFEPAIALIKRHTRYLQLEGDRDYRLLQENPHQTYFLESEKNFSELFSELNRNQKTETNDLLICDRDLEVIRHSESVVWFTFDALCNGPRSKLDYIELANRFSTILISDVPILGGSNDDRDIASGTEDISADNHVRGGRTKKYQLSDNAPRRFMTLVDELYDRGVNLYLLAHVPLNSIYIGEALKFEFQRTRSRLVEMQSLEYLQKK